MTFTEAYHVGIVVADLDASCEEFSDLLGIRWATPQDRDFTVQTPDGEVPSRFRVTYSTRESGEMLIELIEGPPGSPWWPGDGVSAALHHVGFFSHELAVTSAQLSTQGAAREATVLGEDGAPRGFAYHLLQHGPRIELVDQSRRPQLEAWLQGGDFPQA